jgi:hypothetical protein
LITGSLDGLVVGCQNISMLEHRPSRRPLRSTRAKVAVGSEDFAMSLLGRAAVVPGGLGGEDSSPAR